MHLGTYVKYSTSVYLDGEILRIPFQRRRQFPIVQTNSTPVRNSRTHRERNQDFGTVAPAMITRTLPT